MTFAPSEQMHRQVIGSNPICPKRVCNSVAECTAHNRVGGGSIPSIPILTASSSDGRMHDLGSCGRWFESSLAESFVV